MHWKREDYKTEGIWVRRAEWGIPIDHGSWCERIESHDKFLCNRRMVLGNQLPSFAQVVCPERHLPSWKSLRRDEPIQLAKRADVVEPQFGLACGKLAQGNPPDAIRGPVVRKVDAASCTTNQNTSPFSVDVGEVPFASALNVCQPERRQPND